MNSWLVRTLRGRRLDRNPLRRGTDRAETIIALCLLVALVVTLPFVVSVVATRTYGLAHRERVTALGTRRSVAAVTLQAAPPQSRAPYSLIARAWVTARWPAPGGSPRTGKIEVAAGTPKDTPEPVWITKSGSLAAAPLPSAECAELATFGGAGAAMALCALFGIAWAAARGALNHRRMTAWAQDWVAAESRWNRQRW